MWNELYKILQEIGHAHDIDEALLVLVQRIRESIDAQASAIFMVDKHTSAFVLLATKGYSTDNIDIRLSLDEGLLGLVARQKEPVHADDACLCFPLKGLYGEVLRGFIAVPIIYEKRLLGVIVAQRCVVGRFGSLEESFLVTLSAHVAHDIAKAEPAGSIEELYSGVPGSPGVGIGTGFVVFPLADLDAVPDRIVTDIEEEILLFRGALAEIRHEIEYLNKRLETSLAPEDRALFDAYLLMLDDHSLGAEVEQEIRKGQWAQAALRKVIKAHIRQFEDMSNPYLKDRAEDVRDLGQRVLAALQETERKTPDYPEKLILVGEEVTAADLAAVPVGSLMGIISANGSSNSHVAILARSLGVPAVMGVGDLVVAKLQDQAIIVDGYYGHVYVEPSDIVFREFQRLQKEEHLLNEELKHLRKLPAETCDGHCVSMYVNTGLFSDLGISLSVGADGVGLYRSEVPFLSRELFPSVEEQRIIYRQLLMAFSPLPVTMRTLDIGGDKMLPYFPMQEENPCLGWRGVRFTLDHPELFLMQIHAMLLASEDLDNLRIMLPMISDVSEAKEAIDLIHTLHRSLVAEGRSIALPSIGIMVEVPSVLYQIPRIAQLVDFISVGSNDLTQYLLAVDRNNSKVAHLYDSFHPAVLMALAGVVEQAHQATIPVTICGEMAGDPASVLLLLGMGFDGLSMSASRLSRIKWVVRQFSYEQARALYHEVVQMDNATVIRARLESALEEAGLGSLVHAGRH